MTQVTIINRQDFNISKDVDTDFNVGQGAKTDFNVEAPTPTLPSISESATQLVFVDFPFAGVQDTVLDTFTVEAQRTDGSVDTEYAEDITISIDTGTGGLGGTVIKTAVAGVATFDDITIDTAGTFTLAATAGSLSGISSSITIESGFVELDSIDNFYDLRFPSDTNYFTYDEGTNTLQKVASSGVAYATTNSIELPFSFKFKFINGSIDNQNYVYIEGFSSNTYLRLRPNATSLVYVGGALVNGSSLNFNDIRIEAEADGTCRILEGENVWYTFAEKLTGTVYFKMGAYINNSRFEELATKDNNFLQNVYITPSSTYAGLVQNGKSYSAHTGNWRATYNSYNMSWINHVFNAPVRALYRAQQSQGFGGGNGLSQFALETSYRTSESNTWALGGTDNVYDNGSLVGSTVNFNNRVGFDVLEDGTVRAVHLDAFLNVTAVRHVYSTSIPTDNIRIHFGEYYNSEEFRMRIRTEDL